MGSTGVGQEAEEEGEAVSESLSCGFHEDMRQGKRASDWLAQYFQCSGVYRAVPCSLVSGHRLIKFHLAGG